MKKYQDTDAENSVNPTWMNQALLTICPKGTFTLQVPQAPPVCVCSFSTGVDADIKFRMESALLRLLHPLLSANSESREVYGMLQFFFFFY